MDHSLGFHNANVLLNLAVFFLHWQYLKIVLRFPHINAVSNTSDVPIKYIFAPLIISTPFLMYLASRLK